MRAAILLQIVGLCAITGSGCATTFAPPDHPPDPIVVAVADYGRHTSLLLPQDGGLIEYTFGDWNWFAQNRTKFHNAFSALFYSHGATLGRRIIEVNPLAPDLHEKLGADRVMRFAAAGELVTKLRRRLEARFERRLDSLHYNPLHETHFVRDDERYGLFNNCNHLTKRWLRELDVSVTGPAITSDFRMKKQKLKAPPAPAAPRSATAPAGID